MRHARPLSGGMAVHPDAHAVASVAHAHGAEVTARGTMGTRPCDRDPRIRTRPSTATPLAWVEAAGPGGSWRSRDVTTNGEACGVVAPAWSPNTAGDRVHTDRRAALPQARLRRAGARPPVSGPTGDEAAMRALSRARDEPLGALQAATCRRHACLRRPARRDTGRAPGGPAPRRWLAAGVGATPAPPRVCQAYRRAVTAQPARRPRRAPARHAPANAGRVHPGGEALQARRGVPGTGAVTLVAARGDLRRVETPSARRPCVGRVPAA
jgi:transposase